MFIAGLQKLTLLDFPGKVACTVFTAGCNLRCPFCHNSELVLPERQPPKMDAQELLSFLRKRQGILEGVCITGGEPLLQRELPDLLRGIRELGFCIKLDTNGTFPERLRTLAQEGLLDYVAMDIKNSPERYAETVGLSNFDLSKVKESVDFLLSGAVDCEFRTTVCAELHSERDMHTIGQWLQGAKRYFLQEFKDSGDVLTPNLHPPAAQQMEQFRQIVRTYIPNAAIRGESQI